MFTSNIKVSTSSRMSKSLSTSPFFDTSRRRSKRARRFFSVQVDLDLFNCYKIEFDIDLYTWHKTVVFFLDEMMMFNFFSGNLVVIWLFSFHFPSSNDLKYQMKVILCLFFFSHTYVVVKSNSKKK